MTKDPIKNVIGPFSSTERKYLQQMIKCYYSVYIYKEFLESNKKKNTQKNLLGKLAADRNPQVTGDKMQMPYVKRCGASQVIRAMQIKTRMNSIRLANTEKIANTQYWQVSRKDLLTLG